MALHIQVKKEDILPYLTSLQNVAAKKGSMSILGNVLIRTVDSGLELEATDLEIGIRHMVTATIREPGCVTLPAKKLNEVIRVIDADDIEIKEQENSWIKITAGVNVYRMAGTACDEFPAFPSFSVDDSKEVNAKILEKMISKVIFSVAHDKESIRTLTGILFETGTEEAGLFSKMVSSDGHRLSMYTTHEMSLSEKEKQKKIIPKKAGVEILKICESNRSIFINFDNNKMIVKANNSILIISLMEGEYPDYNRVFSIIDKNNEIKVNKNVLLNSLNKIVLFTEDLYNSINLKINNNEILLNSQNNEFGSAKDEINVEYPGEEINISYNCKYLIDILNVIDGEELNIYIKDDNSPAFIESLSDVGFKSVIMPIRI